MNITFSLQEVLFFMEGFFKCLNMRCIQITLIYFFVRKNFTDNFVCNPLICHKPAEFVWRRVPHFATPP